MVAPIKDTVKVSITNTTKGVSSQGFSSILVLGKTAGNTIPPVKIYNITEAKDLGIPTDSVDYNVIATVFSQQTTVDYVLYVGLQEEEQEAEYFQKFSTLPLDGESVVVTVKRYNMGTEQSLPVSVSFTGASTTESVGLTMRESLSTAMKSAGWLSIDSSVGYTKDTTEELAFTLSFGDAGLTDAETDVATSSAVVDYSNFVHVTPQIIDVPTVMAEINTYSSDYYGIVVAGADDIMDNASYIDLAIEAEASNRNLVVFLSNTNVANMAYDPELPEDLASLIFSKGYSHTYCVYSEDSSNRVDAAIMSLQLSKAVGSSTYMYKTLVGVSAENLSSTQRNNLKDKKCNFYETQGGVNIFKYGTVSDTTNLYVDITNGIDYLTTRIEETIFSGLATKEKVDYSPSGIAIIENLLLSALYEYGVKNNILDESSIVVSVPSYSSISVADKADRVLRDVKFSATLLGAIHSVVIEGTVSI